MALTKNDQPHTASVVASSGMPAQLLSHFCGSLGTITEIGNMLCSDDSTKTRIAISSTWVPVASMGKTPAREVIASKIVCGKFKFSDKIRSGWLPKTNMGNFEDDIRRKLMSRLSTLLPRKIIS